MANENSRKLTTDEVNALMEGLSSGEISQQGSGIGSNLEVSPFTFGADDLSLNICLMGIINERDFHIWRFTNRFRFKSLINCFKDNFYKFSSCL